jgi:hypothetical protein
MKTRILFVGFVLALSCLTLVLGCRPRTTAKPLEAQFSLALAPFTQPRETSELLGGYLPDNSEELKAKDLSELDGYLAMELSTESKRKILQPSQIKSCIESSKSSGAATRRQVLDYWVKVGECARVDLVLVPQVLFWKERLGGPGGSSDPASVIVDLYAIDVKNYSLASRYRFNETQVSLTDNLLTAPKFVARKGQWVTAMELAKGGVLEGLKALGLL